MKNEIKNYGLKFAPPDERAYVFGSARLPEVVLKEDGQWDNFLPVYEPQFNQFFDSFGCTVWGTQNALEILLKRITGIEYNFSERFTYILAKVTPPGADPHHIAETIRNNGVIPNDLLPMTSSTRREQFLRPNPMTKEYLNKGLEFPYEVKHEYVWQGSISKEQRTATMKKALRLSPLGISVTAWKEVNGVYVDDGKPNTHWCVCFGWNTKGWKVFDSYDQSIKTLSYDHNIEVCKRYYPEPSTRLPQIGIIQRLINLYKTILTMLENDPTLIEELKPPVAPIVAPVGSLLTEWAIAIRDYEGKPGDLNYRNNNPGNLKKVSGGFMKFATWDAGWKALLDYLTRAATGKHKAYKPDFTLLQFFLVYAPTNDNNYPRKYAEFVGKRINRPITTKIKDLI